jgi:hypothetical protein
MLTHAVLLDFLRKLKISQPNEVEEYVLEATVKWAGLPPKREPGFR